MSRFREFRQAAGYTQEQVADMLKTTQQTVARWESGKAEPSLDALRDLAVIYGTSVDDLLGRNPLSDTAVTTSASYFAPDGDEHFWGHFGVLLPGDKHTRWYPVTWKQAKLVDQTIANLKADQPWLVISTLNNRMLLINVPAVQRLYTLDDNADEVPGDWQLGWDSYSGHSLEVYRALAERWVGIEEGESSETFMRGLDKLIEEAGLTDDAIFERVIETVVYLGDGSEQRCTPDESKLWNAVYEAEHPDSRVFDLSDPDQGLTAYYPAAGVRMIDMPLYQVIDGAKREREGDESASAEQPARVEEPRATYNSEKIRSERVSASSRYFIVEGESLKVLPQKTFRALFFDHAKVLHEYAGKAVRVVSISYEMVNRKPTRILEISAFDFDIDLEGGISKECEEEMMSLNTRVMYEQLSPQEEARRRPVLPDHIKAKVIREVMGDMPQAGERARVPLKVV